MTVEVLQSPWNSLEVAKLLFGLLTPATVVGLGFYLQGATKRIENKQWANQKIVECRLDIYHQMAPKLNDLLCYFTYVGRWREMDPPDLILLKRDLDQTRYLAAPLFPATWAESLRSFTHACFKNSDREWGATAQLRTSIETRESFHRRTWQSGWKKHFCSDQTDPAEIQRLYKNILKEFSRSFGELDFVPSQALSTPLSASTRSERVALAHSSRQAGPSSVNTPPSCP